MGASMSTGITSISAGGLYVEVPLNNSLNIGILVTLVVLLASIVATELFNIHVPYSKFARDDALKELPGQWLRGIFHMQISSRLGFFILYFIPLISYIILWTVLAIENLDNPSIKKVAPSPTYSVLLFAGWCMTFAKRCLEVFFVHIYSGTIPLLSVVLITIGYSGAGLVACAFSNQVFGYDAFNSMDQDTTIVKDILCVIFFVIGITVNFIAHYQLRLARLNNNNNNNFEQQEKKYLSPSEIGWLFKVFICPHYVFEIIMFIAWSLFGATSAHYCIAVGVFFYLGLRLRATYKWYVKQGLIETRRNSQQTMLLATKSNV